MGMIGYYILGFLAVVVFVTHLLSESIVVISLVDTILVLAAILINTKPDRNIDKLWIAVYIPLNILFYIIHQNRIEVSLTILWLLIAMGIELHLYFTKYFNKYNPQDFFPRLLAVLLFVNIRFMPFIFRIELESENAPFLIMAIVGFLTIWVVLFTLNALYDIKRIKDLIVISISFGFFTFLFGSFMFTGLNFSLDTSEPVIVECIIVDKDIKTSTRSPDEYILYYQRVGEEFELHVSKSLYNQYEIGETIEIYEYEGFFGLPYVYIE